MRARISVITLGVADMDRSVRFYRDGLGLPLRDDKPPVAYFPLEGTWIALFPASALASYAGISEGFSDGPSPITLSCNVDSIEAVDQAMAEALTAGADIVKAATEFRWGGYAGWFADPDGHLWEVVYNPRPFMTD
jgi:catechol 2,3-dioxygenase-like lactoylglutathione lyase family enzyme